MKKIIFTVVLFLLITQTYGQLNPITNLNWEHWYNCPNNYFRLTWNTPDISQDTLIGYNVYRNNDLYRFQSDTILNHEENGIGNCPENFLEYNSYGDFWIHVTAVYDSTKIESEYADSVYNEGTIIFISEKEQRNFRLFPNPTTGKLVLDIQNVDKIVLINEQGEIIQIFKNENQLDLSHLPKGIYLLKIYAEDNIITKKIILE